MKRLRDLRGDRRSSRGQTVVEFALLVPVFTLILLGMLEFGFLFDHTLTVQYASREGARVGSALANGSQKVACADVDQYVIAAVERVLNSPGSRVTIADIPQIRIYKATSSGGETSLVNTWRYSAGGGPLVDGSQLDYVQTSAPWPACSRNNGTNPDSIGVSLVYTYRMQTALGAVLGFFGGSGWSTISVSDRTVMSLNPTD